MEGSTNTCYDMGKPQTCYASERSQTQRATYSMIPFILKYPKWASPYRKQINGCQRQEEGGIRSDQMSKGFPLRVMGTF